MAQRNKVALITGGGSGIGMATATVLARQGVDLVLNDIFLERAEKVVAQVQAMGRRAMAIKADVADPDQVTSMLKQASAEMGAIDILLNNAGIISTVAFKDMSREEWERMLAVHLGGTFNCTRGVINPMIERGWGRIISISSIAGMMGEKLAVHYSAAKAALIGFSKALAREVAPYGITVNAIAPGPIETPMLASLSPRFIQGLMKLTPMGRLGRPEDIAYTAAFLASEEASFITGQVISPNGGHYM